MMGFSAQVMNKKFSNIKKFTIPIPFILPLFYLVTIIILNRGGFEKGIDWIFLNFRLFFYSYVLLFSLMNIFLLFFKGKGFLIISHLIGFILSILSYISYVKTELRGEPLSILDFTLIAEASNITEGFGFHYYIPAIIVLIISLIGILLSFFYKQKLHKKESYIIGLISMLVLLSGYLMSIDTLSSRLKISIPADVSWNHDQNGFLIATLIDTKFTKIPKPEGYNRAKMEEIYQKMIESLPEEQNISIRPNVVFVMSESFWDIKQIGNLYLSEEPIPYFKKLSEEQIGGTIDVPGIGGGTANTEFEVLTGLSRRFIPNYNVPYNPYNTYVNGPLYSLAHIFRNEGYISTAIHPYQSWFYRRNIVYKHLGFDRFYSFETLPNRPRYEGGFVNDGIVNKMILDTFQETEERDFIYVVTMEGHGPYEDKVLSENSITVKNNLDETERSIIENYANLMADTDRYLKELTVSLSNIEEPTILVYFGDHIPPIGNQLYQKLGFDIYGEKGKKTPVLIWSNYTRFKDKIDIDANMLGAYVLDLIGYNQYPFMNYLSLFSKQYPHVDSSVDDEWYNDFALIHYDIMHGKKYLYEWLGEPTYSPNYSLGEPLKIKHAQWVNKSDSKWLVIHGSGMNFQTKLVVDDETINPVAAGFRSVAFSFPNDMELSKSEKMRLQILDSREKVVKETSFTVNDITNKDSLETKYWVTMDLSQYDWEVFMKKENITIVRANINQLDNLHFVLKNGQLLDFMSADDMNSPDLSDIYVNGYLYISISNSEANFSESPSNEEIISYLSKMNYQLVLPKH